MKARYRKLSNPKQALHNLLAKIGKPGSLTTEEIPTQEALSRVTARAVYAQNSCPPYHSAAMDGIAVVAKTTHGASATSPKTLTASQAQPIDTGDPIGEAFDAVIPIEQINPTQDGGFEIYQAAFPRQHIRLCGEDMVAGEMITPSGCVLQPAHLGAFLSASVTSVEVRRRPRVAILPTGDELCQPGEDPSQGKVIESNSHMLAGYIRQWGGEPIHLAPQPDQPHVLSLAIEQALPQCDLLLILAGSSAGRDDYTPSLIEKAGELVFHGLSLMPGKPTAAGVVCGKAIIGIPGFPVSAAVACEHLVKPVLAHLLGCAPQTHDELEALLLRPVTSRPGIEEIIRCVVGRFQSGWVAAPLGRGAGAITTLTRAHGLIRIDASKEGLPANTGVKVFLLKQRSELERCLLLAGSNDLALSILDDLLCLHHPGAGLAVSPLGSLAGLAALARKEAHLAGSHLLDPNTGRYNVDDIARILPNQKVMLVTMAYRQQGLCLRTDEQRIPQNLADVLSLGLRWVNRQSGSGTRVLTDHLAGKSGLDLSGLTGWDHEEFTHVAVAEAVRTNVADCGMVILAAAKASGLRFVPLVEERYDLVIGEEHIQDPRIQDLLHVLQSDVFRTRMQALGGYDARDTGKVQMLPR